MSSNGGHKGMGRAPGMMLHDPLADVDDLTSTADDILVGELLPPEPDLVVEEMETPKVVMEPEQESPTVTVETQGGAADDCVVLEGSLTIREVNEVYGQLTQALARGSGDIVIDAGELEQVDGAGLQMLAAFAKDVSSRGHELEWRAVAQVLRASAQQMGLDGLLDL